MNTTNLTPHSKSYIFSEKWERKQQQQQQKKPGIRVFIKKNPNKPHHFQACYKVSLHSEQIPIPSLLVTVKL